MASHPSVRQTFLRSRRSVDEGLVSEREYIEALARREGAPLLETPPGGHLEPLAQTIPPEYMEEFLLAPFERTDAGGIRVAIAREIDPATRREVGAALAAPIEFVVADKAIVLGLIERLYRVDGLEATPAEPPGGEAADEIRDLASQPPVVRLVSFLIHEAYRKKASDIHLEAMEDEFKVRYRVDGILHDITTPPREYQSAVVSRIKILADLDVTERRRPQDGRVRMAIDGNPVDLRISTVPTLHGESIVIRLLDQAVLALPLEDLGLAPEMLSRLARLIHAPQGIVLVTGPTGSGKTTTLYAALARRNSPEVKIVTVEDPVEYQLPGVNQVPVRPEIGLTFATGLRSLVRQDPDIVMVGEMRDHETTEIAIQAALTGHLVFSTLHTNDAAGGITRLLEMGVEPYLVASTVSAILAQRLVRLVCPECVRNGDDGFRRGQGCTACDGTGYRGRTGIFELLVLDDGIRRAIAERADLDSLRVLARERGMWTLREDGLRKARAGLTTIEEVLRVTYEEVDVA